VFDELERGFERLVRGLPVSAEHVSSDDPRMTVLEFENRYVVECDLPGVSVDEASLQLEDNVLVISGQRPAITAAENSKVLFNERASAKFSRRIQMTRPVDQSAVDAELINGVLRVTVPKRAEVLPQKIAIKSGAQSSSS
jgi:HSP20 family protein